MQDTKKYQIIDGDIKACKIESKLCIITASLKENAEVIKKLIQSNPGIQFWLAAKSLDRDGILLANKLGIKNVISYPLDEKVIDTYLKAVNIGNTSAPASETCFEPFEDARVMVVDDNIMNIQLIEEVLRGLDIKLEVYTQPVNALERIKDIKFDLFLLDILMPDISGFDIAEAVKNSELNTNTPVIFISALSDYEYKIAGYNAGACCYVEKPYDVGILKYQIYNLLKKEEIKKKINKAREAFYAMITHDLKTPISAEITALQMLLKKNFGDLTEEQKEIINDILSSVKFMKTMTDNILCSYKQGNSTPQLKTAKEDLISIAESSIQETRYLLEEKNIELCFNSDVKKAPVMADIVEIKRVINNLIGNASEYAPIGSVIVLRLTKSGREYTFSVSDSGCGINLKNPNDIFDKDITFAKERKRVGFGLGLFISKNIVEAHNGRIFAESKVNQGTTITFTLPVI